MLPIVVEFGLATGDDMKPIFKKNKFITEGSPYLHVNCYEKKLNSEFSKNGTVIYRLIKKLAYVLPTHVMSPKVNVTFIGTDVHHSIHEYQWLCDSIGQY